MSRQDITLLTGSALSNMRPSSSVGSFTRGGFSWSDKSDMVR